MHCRTQQFNFTAISNLSPSLSLAMVPLKVVALFAMLTFVRGSARSSGMFETQNGIRNLMAINKTLDGVQTDLRCAAQCISDDNCLSYSYNSNMKICELNHECPIVDDIQDIEYSSAWSVSYRRIQGMFCHKQVLETTSDSMTTQMTTTGPIYSGEHGFSVYDSKTHTYQGFTFLVLKVGFPDDEQSITEDWCRDYQKLCESYGRRPTGCAGRYGTSSYPAYEECNLSYNSDVDINDSQGVDGRGILGCNPAGTIATIANAAFGISSATSNNCIGFHTCEITDCKKDLSLSQDSLSHWGYPQQIVYTVCH